MRRIFRFLCSVKKRYIIIPLILVYLLLVCVPYVFQGGVSAATKSAFSLSDYYSNSEGTDRAEVLFTNEEALTERLRLIEHAEDRIILSTFEFRADNSGKKMLAALYEAAGRGVEVQLVIDGFSYFKNASSRAYFRALGALDNVTIKIYNPVNVLKPYRLMARLHDKYMIVDDEAYILGGRNTYDFFLGTETTYVNYDWDVLVWNSAAGDDAATLTEADSTDNADDNTDGLTGDSSDAAASSSLYQVEEYFNSIWELSVCKVKLDSVNFLNEKKTAEAAAELEELYAEMKTENPDWFAETDYAASTVSTNSIQLLSNPIEASVKEPTLFYNMTELMALSAAGGEDVIFHTPYIMCNSYMMERLEYICSAAAGADADTDTDAGANPDSGSTDLNEDTAADTASVTMMTNSVANNGNPFGASDYQAHRDAILATGLSVLEYDSGVSYHGKCFTIGERLTAIGSFNWDMRSAYLDTELMLVIDSEELNAQMRACMEEYESQALTVNADGSFDLQDGQEASVLTDKKKRRNAFVRPLTLFFRFLL